MVQKEEDTKPVKEGDILTVRIEQEGRKGDGLVTLKRFMIIVRNANKGLTYQIEITRVMATYAFARIIRTINDENKQLEEAEETLNKD